MINSEKQEFTNFLEQAISGNANSMYEVGNKYWHGKGVEEDKKEAIKWLAKAAKLNEIRAQHHLANILFYGKLGGKNIKHAYKWAYTASKQNHIEAKSLMSEIDFQISSKEKQEAITLAETFCEAHNIKI